MVLCHGPVDTILEIQVDRRVAWEGFVSGNEVITVDAPNLFGGDGREGGVSGDVSFLMGGADQLPDAYLIEKLGADIPASRGVVSAVLRQTYMGNNPYLKPWAFKASRTDIKSDGSLQWNISKAQIGKGDDAVIGGDGVDIFFSGKDYAKFFFYEEPDWSTVFPLPGAGGDLDAGVNTGLYAVYAEGSDFQVGGNDWQIYDENTAESCDGDFASKVLGAFVDSALTFNNDDVIAFNGIKSLEQHTAQIYKNLFVVPGIGPRVDFNRSVLAVVKNGSFIVTGNAFIGGAVRVEVNPTVTQFRIRHSIRGLAATGAPSIDPFAGGQGIRFAYSAWQDLPAFVSSSGAETYFVLTTDFKVSMTFEERPEWGGNGYCVIYYDQFLSKVHWINPLTGVCETLSLDTGASFGDGASVLGEFSTTTGYESFGFYKESISDDSGFSFAFTNSRLAALHTDAEPIDGCELLSAFVDTPVCVSCPDMNPAHIIRECLTDNVWGMGYNDGDVDDESFADAANTLFNESMGISILWEREMPIEDFIGEILRHIDAVLYVSRRTGKFVLKLIRDEEVDSQTVVLDESNVSAVQNASRPTISELTNALSVVYWNFETDENASITVHNNALRQIQGAEISTTVQYPGFTNKDIAARVADRDLKALSIPLLSCEITANRDAADLNLGDIFILDWPDLEIGSMVMRVNEMDYGDGVDNSIKITAIEDVFDISASSIQDSQPSLWVDPDGIDPLPPVVQANQEAPYWVLVQTLVSLLLMTSLHWLRMQASRCSLLAVRLLRLMQPSLTT
jgi:hypothetical protein